MASLISCLSILVTPLLVTSLFYQVSNANWALVESNCHNSTEYEFCLSSLLSDERSIKSTLPTLELNSIELDLKVVEVAVNQILDLLKTLTTHWKRLDFKIAKVILVMYIVHENMLSASDGFQNYDKVKTSLTAALLKIGECSDEYESSPKCQSPLSDLTFKMGRLIDISFIIIN